MRSRSSQWFECKAKVAHTQDDGTAKPVPELNVVDALSFTEAEATITEELSMMYSAFEISDIKKAAYGEVFFSDKDTDDKWFKAKLQFIIYDEKSNKEKKSNVYYLVQAHSFTQAVEYIHEAMKGNTSDYLINTLQETMIMGVFEHNKIAEKKEEE
ncbi:MAG: DUF4494 domain-containing protein [Bacteroidaceae bacterium]|nr:DUF4494 domain-containing protein [Bacteroidaceae bacterium]